jgi:hypothetical protein
MADTDQVVVGLGVGSGALADCVMNVGGRQYGLGATITMPYGS